MEYKKTIPVALLVFGLSFLIFFADNITPAFAFSTYVVNTTASSTATAYDSANKLYVVKNSLASPFRTITTINALTGTVATITLEVPASGGVYGTGIGCVAGECFIGQNGAGAADYIIGFDPRDGTITHNSTIGSLASGLSTLDPDTNGSMKSLGYHKAICTTGSARILISPISPSIGSCSGTNFGLNDIRSAVYNGVDSLGVIAANAFSIWTISSGTRNCNTGIVVGSNPLGTIAYFNNNWYATVGSQAQIDQFNTSCVRSSNYITNHGQTTINGIWFSSTMDSVFIVGASTTSVMNITSSQFSTLAYTINYGAASAGTSTSALGSNVNQVGLMGATTFRVLQIDAIAQEEEEETGGVDCSDPDFSYRLICNIQGNSGLVGASQLINQSGTNIACQIGLLSCTQDEDGNFVPDNPDIQTNGLGYILAAIAIGIFVGILWVASRGQLTDIPTFIWFIGSIAIIGAITAIGWIDPTFLIIAVITIVGFAVAKARGLLGGSGLFGD